MSSYKEKRFKRTSSLLRLKKKGNCQKKIGNRFQLVFSNKIKVNKEYILDTKIVENKTEKLHKKMHSYSSRYWSDLCFDSKI